MNFVFRALPTNQMTWKSDSERSTKTEYLWKIEKQNKKKKQKKLKIIKL